jgi:hypothetical protein
MTTETLTSPTDAERPTLTASQSRSREPQSPHREERSFPEQSLTGADINFYKERVSQLQGKVDEFRANNILLMKDKESLTERVTKMSDELNEVKGNVVSKDESISLLEKMKGEYEASIGLLSQSVMTIAAKFNDVLIKNTVQDVALKEGVIPSALEDVTLRIKNNVEVVDNARVIVYNQDKKEISVTDWLGELKKSAPHLFYQSTGGGAKGNVGTTVTDDSAMNSVQKILAGLSKLK